MNTREFKLGLIGLGQRGMQHLNLLLTFPKVNVVAVCDKYADRAEDAAKLVNEKRGVLPLSTTDYKALLASKDVEVVLIATDWELHVPIAIDAMRAGKTVALEVGGAYTVDDCYRLVKTWEDTRVPFMFLENCCYNKDELLGTAMARDGKFGKIVHCVGSYSHDLRNEVAFGKENRHYRLRNYLARNAENYPTHELGPIAKVLDINRGNRMVSLVAVASMAAGMEDYVEKNKDKVDPALIGRKWAQGDIVNTVITCQNGETILMTLDTTLPRSYTRSFTLRGTNGFYTQDTNAVFLDGDAEEWEPASFNKKTLDSAKAFEEQYLPKVWKDITPEAIAAGHGGMDAVMWESFFTALENGDPMPIDVYDAASWMVITALSEESIRMGGTPQQIPDFTQGAWLFRDRLDVMKL